MPVRHLVHLYFRSNTRLFPLRLPYLPCTLTATSASDSREALRATCIAPHIIFLAIDLAIQHGHQRCQHLFTQVLLFVEPTQQQSTKTENPLAVVLALQPPVHLNSPTPQDITTTPRSIAGVAVAVGILPLLFGTLSPHHTSRPKQHKKSEDKVDAWLWRRRRFRLLYRRL